MTALYAFAPPAVETGFDTAVPMFSTVEEVVSTIADDQPIHVLYRQTIEAAARAFLTGFPGQVMYAVKCNPTPAVLETLSMAGIRNFDVASIEEIDAVRRIDHSARLYFMHPVKSRRAIRYAYLAGVRDFALDSEDELAKILEETQASDLSLFVRLGLPKGDAALDLSGKFGIAGDEAVSLLRAARKASKSLAVSFHVGSQCMNPESYARAIEKVRALVDQAGVTIDSLDVGGGFPVAYPDMTPPPLEAFMEAITEAVVDNGFGDTDLLCEPGRALVGEGGSVLVKVELRKGNALYLNDGTFGALFDAGSIGWRYPVRRVDVRNRKEAAHGQETMEAFRFFGPTCDSMDVMEGPFLLPADIGEGDWIEIGHLGAYGISMRTRFNGFHSDLTVAVGPREAQGTNVVPLPLTLGTAMANT
ncbi:ornithine decarboxylase [Iodidimonas gelatinilytica]|uniref:ornithine decarboxylase n=1 Tax=Iodidimonas gelatinilytica TaxID=1236966 RepID=A0A5A7MW17_9PROT|nr:type III PLP-dependent enzyme [Iodidimonas gelatinilytica]GER00122.1 ornithine decarboxylase [Iodidimonas gelatinilytica]